MREPRRIEGRRERGVGLGVVLPSALLPAHIAVVIRRVAAELRNVPRAAVTDRLELVHWLGRQARNLDDVAGSRMLQAAPAAKPAVVPIAAPLPCLVCEARHRKPRRRGTMLAGQLALPFPDHFSRD